MSLYVDTSAIAKVLRLEPGHEIAAAALGDPGLVATSVISYTETCAALARATASPAHLTAARAQLDRLWAQVHLIPVDDAGAQAAGALALRHRLRGMGAIHLSAALRWAADAGAPFTFLSWDDDQREAARREGLHLLPEAP